MFDIIREDIRHSRELAKLNKSRRTLDKKFAELIQVAREAKAQDEVESLIHQHMFEINFIDDEVSSIMTSYLCRMTSCYLIPIPEFAKDVTHQQSKITGRWHLSPIELAKLRAAVRAEKKERRENIRGWIALFIGVVGALTGLPSVLLKTSH